MSRFVDDHLAGEGIVYVRHSTMDQVINNVESRRLNMDWSSEPDSLGGPMSA